MYKILLLLLTTTILFAQPQTDVSLTIGYNDFNDPDFLRRFRNFYGIRVGVYQENNSAVQFGYEQANGANCQGLNLKRFYLNGIRYLDPVTNNINLYGVATGGYEISNIHAHKPSQLFAGLGAGIRITLNPQFYTFLESRILKKLQTGDTDFITTVGLAYQFKPQSVTDTKTPTFYSGEILTAANAPEIIAKETVLREETVSVKPKTPSHIRHIKANKPSRYYVQLGLFAKTDPKSLVRKARRKGFHAKIKHIVRDGKKMKLVVAGPYRNRQQAKRKLYRLRKIVPDAFIIKR